MDYYILNDEVEALENQLSGYLGDGHFAVMVDRAAGGLFLALKAAGVRPGDGVLCSALGFSNLTQAIEQAGAVPVFVDINPNTFNLDPYCLDYVIRKCKRDLRPIPKALIAVDLFGLPCNYAGIEEVCSAFGITVIEYMASAFEAEAEERKAGSFGRFAVASFFAANPLGTSWGEDGAVFCRDPRDAEKLRQLRRGNAIQQRLEESLQVRTSSISWIQATLVAEKYKRFQDEVERRRRVADCYRSFLPREARPQGEPQGWRSAYTQFVVTLPDKACRDHVARFLRSEYIPCARHNPVALNRVEEFFEQNRVILLNAEKTSSRLLSLPMHPYLSTHVVEYICGCIHKALSRYREEGVVVESDGGEVKIPEVVTV